LLDHSKTDGAQYHISSFSGGGNCVAVARLSDGQIIVKHSRKDDSQLVFNEEEWAAFVAGVKNDEFGT
jgi:Domain of unknown function (DUF397)